MTPEKVIEVVEIYRQQFLEANIKKIDYPHDYFLYRTKSGLEHCHGMLDKIIEFVRENKMEKAFRWLGFVQGILWSSGICTLTDLKNHNRPPENS